MIPNPNPAPTSAPRSGPGRIFRKLQLLPTNVEPDPGPQVLALPRKDRIYGFSDSQPNVPTFAPVTLREALTRRWSTDAHAAGYLSNDPYLLELGKQPRQNKLDHEDTSDVFAHSVWLDLDRPKHQKRTNVAEDLKAERAAIEAAFGFGLPRPFAIYATRGGWRLVWVLLSPVLVAEIEPYLRGLIYRAQCAGLGKDGRLAADESCADWPHLMRLPNVVRINDDGTTETTWEADYMANGVEFLDSAPLDIRDEIEPIEDEGAQDTNRAAVEHSDPFDLDTVPEAMRETVDAARTNYVAKALDDATQRIVAVAHGEGQGRRTVYGQSCGIGQLVGAGLLDYDDAEARLFAAVEKRHETEGHGKIPDKQKVVRNGLNQGEKEPRDWRALVERWTKDANYSARVGQNVRAERESEPAQEPEPLPEPKNFAGQGAWLDYLNQKHAVIRDYGSKCRIVGWRLENVGGDDEEKREVIFAQSFADFSGGYANKRVKIPTPTADKPDAAEILPVAPWWFQNDERREFQQVVYAPNKPREFGGCLNLWRGFGVVPAPGDWSLMKRHVLEVLAAGNREHADYILRWAAWAVQNPGLPAEVALAFLGDEGTGKGTFGAAMVRLFGRHGLQIYSAKHLTGNFNSHLRDCSFLFADEAVAPSDAQGQGVLKGLVTEKSLLIEPKGVDAIPFRNCLHVCMASNNEWIVPAGNQSRRFVVFNISDAHREDRAWFGPLYAQLEAGGLAAMLHDLLAMDLGDWHPRQDRPRTDALAQQRALSLQGVDRLWFDCLSSGELPAGTRQQDGSVHLSTSDLLDRFRELDRGALITSNRLLALLTTPQAKNEKGMEFEDFRRGNRRTIVVPVLAVARARWSAVRFPIAWKDDAEGWSIASRTPR